MIKKEVLMQVNGLKDNTKVLDLGLKEVGKEVKETESANEKISLGEAFNKNIRTKIMTYGDTVNKLKGEDREVANFKEEAEKKTKVLEHNAKALTPEVMKNLEDEGVSATDSDADLVKKSIENIVANREMRKENLAKQAEKLSEDADDIRKISYSTEGNPELAKQLERSGMAVTKENIAKLSEAVDFAKRTVNNMNEPAIGHMIETDLPETISNLYMAEYSEIQGGKVESVESEETWAKIENQAANLLENQGVDADKESLKAAKWLFTKGIEITPASVAKFLSLNELKTEVKSTGGIENLTKKLAAGLSEGKDTGSIVVGTANNKQAGYVVNYFKRTTEISVTEISQRRNLEEIRLKLTEQSALNMLNKGIKIDVTDLKGLVLNLRKEEDSYYKALLDGAKTLENDDFSETKKIDAAANQIEIFRSVVSIRSYAITREYTSDYKAGAISETYRQETKITLAAYHQAGLAYEKGATVVRADLGDSVKKAFGNIDEVLNENNLELNDANRRAVKILAYNKAEVTVESVTKMKAAAALTENTLKELKPATVAGLIKSGINPLDMEMEELLSAAKDINEKIIPNDEKYSRYLYNLEKNGDNAAIGSVSLASQSLTLRNMLSAIRTGKLRGFNEKVDESFGELSQLLGGKGKIDGQIDMAYAKLLAGELKESLSEVDMDYYETKETEILRDIQTTDVEKMLDAGAEITFSNLSAQINITKGRKNLLGIVSEMTDEDKSEVNELSSKFIDEFDGERFAAENEKAVTDALSKKVTKMMETEDVSFDRFNGFMSIKRTIALSVKRVESKTYDIPFIYDEDKLADLSITLRKGSSEADKGKVGIILTTNEGRITSEFRIVSERITGYFKAEARENLDNLKVNEEILKRQLSEMKLEIGEISYHLGLGTSQITNSDDIYNDNVKISDIYRTAKVVAAYMLKVLGVRE